MSLWPWSCLGNCFETIHGNCFIFSGHINLTWDLCPVGSFWAFPLRSWNYDLLLEIIVRAIAGKYTRQLFHIFRTVQSWMKPSNVRFILTFWPSTFKLWPSPWKLFLSHCLETINGKCFIISGHQPGMEPVHFKVILALWLLTLILWPSANGSPLLCHDQCSILGAAIPHASHW